jgi:hypothetical protein
MGRKSAKSSARTELFKNKALDTPFPPTPEITRWGTLFDAIVFLQKTFKSFVL